MKKTFWLAYDMSFSQSRVRLFRTCYKNICGSKTMNLNNTMFKPSVRRPL